MYINISLQLCNNYATVHGYTMLKCTQSYSQIAVDYLLDRKVRTSPLVEIAQDNPSSPAAAAAASAARFTSTAFVVVPIASAVSIDDDDHAGIAAMDRFLVGEVGIAAPAPAAAPGGGGFDAAGRKRRRTSLALGPAAGTRRSSSRWRMRSALICGKLFWMLRLQFEGRRGSGSGEQGMRWTTPGQKFAEASGWIHGQGSHQEMWWIMW